MSQDKITVEDVRRSINYNISMNFIVRRFGRPMANLLTPAFYNSGWTADGVTYLRAVFAFLALFLLTLPYLWSAIAAGSIFYVCFVLDCVDGNLARLRQSTTYWGKFIDGLADFLFILGAPFAVGMSLVLMDGDPIWLIAGGSITIASLTSQMIRNRLSFTREWMVNQTEPLSTETLDQVARPRKVQSIAAEIYVNGTFIAPLLLVIPGDGRQAYLVLLLAVQFLCEVVWTLATFAEARVILDRPRRSIHAASTKPQAGQVKSTR